MSQNHSLAIFYAKMQDTKDQEQYFHIPRTWRNLTWIDHHINHQFVDLETRKLERK